MFSPSIPFYSPESISFQKDRFHRELTAIVEQARTKNTKDFSDLEISLSKCIKDNCNINFDVQVGDHQMSTEPPSIDKNSPMIQGYGWEDSTLSKTSLADVRKSTAKEVRALIDSNAMWVDGYFANLPPVRMLLNASMLIGNNSFMHKLFDGRKYTPGEISAIILHEVGHIWTFFEFIVRFRTTNQILQAMIRELDGTEDHGKREITIREAGEALGLKDIDAQDLMRKKDVTVYTVVISNLARLNRSQTGVEGYDINSFEALSDQFATRNGAGRDLVTALDKLYKGTIYRRGWVSYLFVEFLKVAVAILGIAGVASGNVVGAYNIFVLLTGLLLADSHHDWYDKGGYRFKRIRNQLIEELKNPNLERENAARIRYDIDMIDQVAERYKDHTQLIGLVYDYLIPSGITKRKEIEFQQQLEGLAANKLFYYSTAFKIL